MNRHDAQDTTSPAAKLRDQLASAIRETAYVPLSSPDKDRVRLALVAAALRALSEVGREARMACQGGREVTQAKPSLAYLKRALEMAEAASPIAKEAALAIDLVREVSDRLAALEYVPLDIALIPAILHTGADSEEVFISRGGDRGAAPAILLANLIGADLHRLVADCWVASREENQKLRDYWLKNAGCPVSE